MKTKIKNKLLKFYYRILSWFKNKPQVITVDESHLPPTVPVETPSQAELLILAPMDATRKYCSLIHKLRKENDIPVSYPLYEARVNSLDLTHKGSPIFLTRDHLNLIKDECNIEWVEPFLGGEWSKYAEVVGTEDEEYKVELDITKDHYLERQHLERKAHREKMRERKEKGLAYED